MKLFLPPTAAPDHGKLATPLVLKLDQWCHHNDGKVVQAQIEFLVDIFDMLFDGPGMGASHLDFIEE